MKINYFTNRYALVFYAVLTIFCLVIISHPIEIKISKFLATLTQELIIGEINPVRISYGFSVLKPNEKLTRAAELKAADMIARNYFSHTGPNQELPWFWLDKVGYNYVAAGENLAMDVNDPEALKEAWLASPSHAKNILNSYFTDIGVSVAKGKINGRETMVVVMFLGKEISPEIEKSSFSQAALEQSIKNIPPEKPVVVGTIEEDKKLAIVSNTRKNGVNSIFLFFLNKFPKTLRLLLTIFYCFLIIWLFILHLRIPRSLLPKTSLRAKGAGFINLIFKKQKTSFIISRSLILLIFIISLWLR